MNQPSSWKIRLCALSLAATIIIPMSSGMVYAGDNRHDRYVHYDKRDHHDNKHKDRYSKKRHHKEHHYPRVIHRGHRYVVPHKRVRHHRNVVVVRPYGHWYHGYGHYNVDDDAYKWLAFTAITLKILDNLNEQQQREHESAQVKATTAPIGEKIIWQNGNVQGSVTPTRDGTSTAGRYCREFLQEVRIGGKTEQAYGTACRQPDGTWEVVSTDSE